MKISFVCVGKIKEKYLKDLITEYQTRMRKYCKFEIYEVKDEVLRDESDLGITKVLELESTKIIKYIDKDAYKISLVIEGNQISSEDLAKKIESCFNISSHIQFVIGGSYGLSDEIKSLCDYQLSFSKMTFPHQLMRGILLEQVYRSFRIIHNESYHK